jgi:hypothetical protein
MKSLKVMLPLLGGLAIATAATAQDKGRVGLVMGYPGSIAFLWHATEAIGIRPELAIVRSSNDVTSTSLAGTPTTTTSTGLGTTVGVSLVCYGATHDNLRIYFSPRAVYVRSTIKTQSGGVVPSSQATSSGYAASGSVGGQYALGHRFSAYAEVGYGFSHSSQGGVASGKGNSISPRTAVGGVLYF